MKKNELVRQLIYCFMRLGLLPLMLINCLCVVIYASPTNGQEILNKKINLVADQQEVKAVLSEISKLAEIKFVYSAQMVPARKKVSLSARDQSLREVSLPATGTAQHFLPGVRQPDRAHAKRR